ncbi:MAG: leucyl/phenylalanyl-tRNA--protein transferase [Rhodoferax sp.]|nr:leucyl/phenylalanyl-tRNA--protein transferase [Rhodoferax sp.]MBK9237677.1 leucyl/phenylalanyl-tRNA--protein transferase [Rhodoferax sp.]
MSSSAGDLPWLAPHQAFPPASHAWPAGSAAPGLLAAGGVLDVATLCQAYRHGIFPWFSDDQPILWWSPDPRMILKTSQLRMHRSLRQAVQQFRRSPGCEIRIDSAFEQVINGCASSPRVGQSGTWIVPAMIDAYVALHHAGFAHSVETWIDGRLCGGLYCVAIGRAVFGESMFTRVSNGSKIALAALVSLCAHHGIVQIDCQQNTRHLAHMGATEISRADFLIGVGHGVSQTAPVWQFDPLYWQLLLHSKQDLA